MFSVDLATHTRLSLREVVSAAPTKTLIAAGVLGLMWGPILASILQVADAPPEVMTEAPEDISVAAIATVDPMPVIMPVPTDQPAAMRATVVPSPQIASIEHQDAAIDTLSTLTRFHRLSNTGLPPVVDDAVHD